MNGAASQEVHFSAELLRPGINIPEELYMFPNGNGK